MHISLSLFPLSHYHSSIITNTTHHLSAEATSSRGLWATFPPAPGHTGKRGQARGDPGERSYSHVQVVLFTSFLALWIILTVGSVWGLTECLRNGVVVLEMVEFAGGKCHVCVRKMYL